MAETRYRCEHCRAINAASDWPPIDVDPGVGSFAVCPSCGVRCYMTERMTVVPEQPPLSRDSLLHEIARSLRATHPDRAEELIAAAERAMPMRFDTRAYVQMVTPAQANAMIREIGFLPGNVMIMEPIKIAEPSHPAPTANTPFDWTDQ